MPTIVSWLLATALFMFLHLSIMALCARLLGIGVRSIGYGVGPALFSIGKARIRLLPFAGSLLLSAGLDVAGQLLATPGAYIRPADSNRDLSAAPEVKVR